MVAAAVIVWHDAAKLVFVYAGAGIIPNATARLKVVGEAVLLSTSTKTVRAIALELSKMRVSVVPVWALEPVRQTCEKSGTHISVPSTRLRTGLKPALVAVTVRRWLAGMVTA